MHLARLKYAYREIDAPQITGRWNKRRLFACACRTGVTHTYLHVAIYTPDKHFYLAIAEKADPTLDLERLKFGNGVGKQRVWRQARDGILSGYRILDWY